MELGMVGLGRMGGNMAERLLRGGHRVVGYAPTPDKVQRLVSLGGVGAESLESLARALAPPRAVWLMIPAGNPVDETIDRLAPELGAGDIIVDGGNSYYKDTLCRGQMLAESGIRFVDAGTSGGVWGLEEGYSLMVGGERDAIEHLAPIFQTLAPAPDLGWGRVGSGGAGHFVKMVHNGIEYGMMQAIAEGFSLLSRKDGFGLDVAQIAQIWRHGSVVRSWLLDLAARALQENPSLEGISAYVEDSGEGRWTVMESLDLEVAIPVITLALQRRFRSREDDPFGDRLLAALRQQFGGHAVRSDSKVRTAPDALAPGGDER